MTSKDPSAPGRGALYFRGYHKSPFLAARNFGEIPITI